MARKDREFLKRLGISQKVVADAIDRTPQAVSSGIAQDAAYFDLKKFNLLEAYFLQNGGISQTEFREAKQRYLTEDGDPELSENSRKPIDDDFTQLWIFTGNADVERTAREAVDRALETNRNPKRSVALIVPDAEAAHLSFQIITASLFKRDYAPQIYVLEYPGCGPCKLNVVNPQGRFPEVYTTLKDGTLAQLAPEIIQPVIRLFKSHGYGAAGDEFFKEITVLRNSAQLKLHYVTDNFFHGNGMPVRVPESGN